MQASRVASRHLSQQLSYCDGFNRCPQFPESPPSDVIEFFFLRAWLDFVTFLMKSVMRLHGGDSPLTR